MKFRHTEEAKMRIGLASKNRVRIPMSESQKDKIRQTLKKYWTPNRRAAQGKRTIGNKINSGRVWSDESREKQRQSFAKRTEGRENHPRWISDRSKLKTDREHAYDYRYKDWMKQVKNRDGWKCCIANGNCSGRVESHHILSWRDYPELRYQINNGITLCHFHHPRGKKMEDEMQDIFKGLIAGKAQ